MRRGLAARLRRAANRLEPREPLRNIELVIPGKGRTIFNSAAMEGLRRELALSLMDDETLGYVCVLVQQEDDAVCLDLACALGEEFWAPMRVVLSRVVMESERALGR